MAEALDATRQQAVPCVIDEVLRAAVENRSPHRQYRWRFLEQAWIAHPHGGVMPSLLPDS